MGVGKDVGKEAEKGGRSRMRMGFEGQAGRTRQVLPEIKGLFNSSMLLLLMSLGVCNSGVQESDVGVKLGWIGVGGPDSFTSILHQANNIQVSQSPGKHKTQRASTKIQDLEVWEYRKREREKRCKN